MAIENMPGEKPGCAPFLLLTAGFGARRGLSTGAGASHAMPLPASSNKPKPPLSESLDGDAFGCACSA